MYAIIAQRVTQLKRDQASVQQELAHLAARQQALLQEALRLDGAIRELETIVVAIPTPVDGSVVVPQGD